jgi:Tfp pilus assembly protein PilF
LRERRSKPAAGQGGPPTKRLEPWQIASGAAVLLLIAVFVYLELSREHPPSQVASGISSAQGVAPMTSPMANLAPLEQAVRENPRDPEALLALANARHDVGQFPLAIETYQRYLQEKPGDPNARVDLGICYFELGRLDSVNAETLFMQAMEEMQRVHRKHPRHQQATFNLGIVNLVRRDLKEASRWFQKTVEIDKASELGQRAQQMLQQHAAIP